MNEDIKKQLELISYLPKADLHYHIDGSIRPATILAKESIRYIELRFAPFYGSGDITA